MLRNGLEPWHLLLVALVCILLFGSKKLPEAARGLGKSMRILKSEARAMKAEEGDEAANAAVYTEVSAETQVAHPEAEGAHPEAK
ncbi:MAG: sec-independent protein translocase protein TatA [Streptomyces sp.]|jgi:sec-independent protein translocase protein TatA|nr:sec-independent protein translocase protein TatA [Streptomyces sp.]